MKIITSREDSGLLTKAVTQTIKNITKNKGMDFSVCY